MWTLKNKSKVPLSVEVDILDLCKGSVRRIHESVKGGNLLNQRQCFDLSSKLSKTYVNIQKLVFHCGPPAVGLFRPALENLYRCVEKARTLVNECGAEEWWVATVVQSQNENAFRDILLDISFCYHAIYEQAKCIRKDFDFRRDGLRESSVFRSATNSDIQEDQEDLRRRLEGLAIASVSLLDRFLPRRGASKQYLAQYLLVKLNWTCKQAQVNKLDPCSAILWTKETEPSGTWGNYKPLGSGVCSTEWMGIPCAKKVFHEEGSEGFFLKEAGILACLKHPCIVNFFCCGNGEESGDRFIAMELMEKSLSKLIEQQKGVYFPLSTVVEMMVQMARGMKYLHDQGVAHRDLKPQNVVVNRLRCPPISDQFCIKLVDFGMSKTKVEMSKSNTMTAPGIGTTIYRAPEVHPDANRDGKGKVNWSKADVFSFSMTCAHLLSLKRPFGDMASLRELYSEVMGGTRPRLPGEYPEVLLGLLRDCWKLDPCSRPSFVEICRRLEMIRHSMMRGYPMVDEGLHGEQRNEKGGFGLIESIIHLKSSLPRPVIVEQCETNVVVPTIRCSYGHALECIPLPPYFNKLARCNICRQSIGTTDYHCKICYFDAHPECAEIKDKVDVFFHAHPLHLLTENHDEHKPGFICGFCKESVEGDEIVYKCEQCDFNAHVLCTKYPMEWKFFGTIATLVQTMPCISKSCACCSGDLEGYYYAFTGALYPLAVHADCSFFLTEDPTFRLCDCLGNLRVSTHMSTRFYCSSCKTFGGPSWHFSCHHCSVNTHIDCVDDMMKEENKWIEAYYKFEALEYVANDDHLKLVTISELLDRLLVSTALEESSSPSSTAQREVKMALPTTETMVAYWLCLQFSTDPKVAGFINFVAGTDDWIANSYFKRMAAKKAWQKMKANPKAELGAMLENLENLLGNLEKSNVMFQINTEVFAAERVKLKKLYFALQTNTSIWTGPLPFTASSSRLAHLVPNDSPSLFPESSELPATLGM